MAKYISGRSKLTPQTGLSSDRYRYLSVSESEPNLGDPLIGPSAYDPNLVPAGNQYIVVGVDGHPGERYWIPNQGGIIPGSLSVFEEGTLVGGLSSTTQLNFKGLGITAEGVGGANPGVAVTITVAPPGNNNSVLFKNNNDFATDARFTFDDGLFAAGDRITVGTGGTFITTTGIGSVGIGTTDPTQKLHLNGDFRITGTIYDSTNQPGSQGNLITKTATGGLLWVSPNAVQSGAGGAIGQIQYHNAVGLVDGGDNFYYDFNNNRVGIGSTQPTQLLDVLGVSTFSGGVFVDTLSVSGLSTFTGLIDANGGIDVFGHTETDTLNVSGLSTFVSNVDMDAGLDVDGHTELDNVNISGIASFTDTTDNTLGTTNTGGVQIGGGVGINSNLTVGLGISAQNLYITGVGTIGTFDFGTGDFDSITVSGVSTLGNVVVDGNTVSTKSGAGNLIIDSDGETSVVVKDFILLQKTTESTSTDTGALQVDGGVGINKSVNIGLNLNVGGAVSFTGPSVGVAVTLAAAGGITTTGGDLYVGGDLYINDDIAFDDLTARTGTFTESLDITGHTETDTLNVSGISSFNDDTYFKGVNTVDVFWDNSENTFDFSDDAYAGFGNSNQLKVSGSAAGGTIELSGTSPTSGLFIKKGGTTESIANFIIDGGVELYYDNSKKFETTGYGVTVTGGLSVSGITTFQDSVNITGIGKSIRIGLDSDQLQLIYDTGGTGYIQHNNELFVSSKEGVKFYNEGLTRNTANFYSKGAIELFHSTNTTSSKKFETTSSGVNITGHTETDTLNVSGISTLGDANSDTVTFNARVDSSIIPSTNETFDLGSSSLKWNDVHATTFNGAFQGNADTATKIGIGSTNTNSSHFLTFVDSNNSSRDNELLYTNSGIVYNPSTGYLGIGTDNPTAKLEVATSVDGEATLATFKNTSGGGTNETVDIKLGLQNTVASNVILRAGKEGNHSSSGSADNFFAVHTTLDNTSSERLRITSDGNVSLTQNLLIPEDKKIHLEGSSSDDLNAIWKADTENTVFVTSRYNIANIIDSNNDDEVSFWSVRHNATTLAGSGELMRVQSNGNVGIGTDDPAEKLQVAGNVVPSVTETHDLGTSSLKWNDVHATTFTGAFQGNAESATKLDTPRTFTLGDGTDDDIVSIGKTFDGTQNVGFALTLKNTGPGIGIYGGENTKVLSLSIDDKGRITGITSTSIDFGNANVATADSLTNSRNFGASGDATAPNVSFNGTADVDLVLTLSNTGVTEGTYGSSTQVGIVTVDAKGRITAASNTAIDFGNANVATADSLTNSRNFGASGDATAPNVSFNGTADVDLALTLANSGVTEGTYGSSTQVGIVTVDAKGRITAASNVSIDFGSATVNKANYADNAGIATYADNAGIATNLKGGNAYQIPYQSSANTTSFIANGTLNQVLTSNGPNADPTWKTVSGSSASAAGQTGAIQFKNSSGNFDGDVEKFGVDSGSTPRLGIGTDITDSNNYQSPNFPNTLVIKGKTSGFADYSNGIQIIQGDGLELFSSLGFVDNNTSKVASVGSLFALSPWGKNVLVFSVEDNSTDSSAILHLIADSPNDDYSLAPAPSNTNIIDLGKSDNKWKDLYVGSNVSIGKSIYDANGDFGTDGQVLSNVTGVGVSWTDQTVADKIFEGNTSAEVVDTGTDGHFKVLTEGVERLCITSTGRIEQKANNEDIDMDSTASGQLKLDGNGYNAALSLNATGLNIYHNSGSRGIIFGTNETEKLRITSVGKVGIGSTQPTAKLDVSGNTAITGTLTVTDDITAFYSSDERLKKNISPIKNALEKVSEISGNTFEWNEKTPNEGKEVGVIAQEVEKLGLPGVTTTRQDGTKAVRYEKLVPLLIEAIKELKDQVDELKRSK